MILSIGTFDDFAAEEAADLKLCAVKIDVSIPESFKTSFSHLLIVFVDTLQCGLT